LGFRHVSDGRSRKLRRAHQTRHRPHGQRRIAFARTRAGGGIRDPDAAKTRLDLLAPIPILPITEESERIADAILLAKAIPASEPRDALHVGICAAHDIDYLLTWNFKHLANAHMARKIDEVLVANGRRPPLICTPEPLME
jgi:hypothetical protein